MEDFKGRKLKKKNLPAPYVNPWYLLFKKIKSIAADFKLRATEVLRKNNKNILPTPELLNPNIAIYFWPALLLTILITISLFVVNHEFSLKDSFQPSTINSELVILSNENNIIDNFSNRQLPNDFISSIPSQSISYELKPDTLEMFVSRDEFNKVDANLFVGADITSLDNIIVLGVGLVWKNLDPSQKKINLQELLDRSEVLGYGDLYVVNETGQLLARRSRVGTGMLLLDEGGI